MEIIKAVWDAVVAQPMAGVMALLALACAVAAISFRMRARDRLAAAALAVMSGISAWMLAGGWRWPE